MDFGSGQLLTFQTVSDKIEDLSEFLDFLPDTNMDTALLRRLGINGRDGNTIKSTKYSWTQIALRPREEVITIDDSATTLTVADAYIYQVDELLRSDNEIMRVTAIASATTLTVVRGYGDTDPAAHSSKLVFSVGKAAKENSTPGASVFDTPEKLTNYVQTFDVPVEVSNDQIASETVDGNTLDGQLERRFMEINRQLARASIYGIKYQDSSNKINSMGGLKSFLSSNVTNVGGALTAAGIDAALLAIVNAGGMPKTIAVSPYQKQKLDALDVNRQQIGKREKVGGNLNTQVWQSGILNYDLDVVVDKTILTSELYILDDEMVEILPFSNNGVSGTWGTYDATAPGQDGVKRIIRGKYGLKVHNEKTHALLYGLS